VDVVAIGDSFTWCSGLRAEDAWPAQLAPLLGRTVWNLGRGGIGLHEELQILRRFGLAKRPRVVILNFYEGNDLRDALRFAQHAGATPAERQALRDATRARQGRAEHAAALDHPLGRHSYAFTCSRWNQPASRPPPSRRAQAARG
jgi:lysophospholipase L1-like esterase